MGDPIFVDSSTGQFTVYTAAHGEGAWQPYIISNSLFEFKEIIGLLRKMSIGRTNPVEIEENPIDDKDKADFLRYVNKKIQIQNFGIGSNFLNNLNDSNREIWSLIALQIGLNKKSNQI